MPCLVSNKYSLGIFSNVKLVGRSSSIFPSTVPEGFPLSVQAVALDSRTLHIVWSSLLPGEENGEIVRYGVNLTEVETGRVTQHLTSDSVTSLTIPLLHPHYHYQYAVTAFTSAGNGPYSLTYVKQMPQDGLFTSRAQYSQ